MRKISAYIQVCRPHQYVKNGFIWLPLFFGDRITDMHAVAKAFLVFVAFSLMSSAIYAVNDLKDRAEDRRHPVKKNRPIARGDLSPAEAVGIALVLFGIAMAIASAALPLASIYVLLAYMLLNLAYSQGIKHIPIIDIVCIAAGFVLRVLAGGTATRIAISPWIVIMTFLLALFLALAKRRDDLLLVARGKAVRKAIDGYNLEFISLAMGIMASVIIVAYLLYTVSPEVVAKHGTENLYVTAIWVLLGLLRYLQITFVEEKSGSPTMVLLKDALLQVVIVLWLANSFLLLYR
jgi:decaprenyl-phosphate phosphoribosyltransferase